MYGWRLEVFRAIPEKPEDISSEKRGKKVEHFSVVY